MKNSLEGLKNRFELAEESINKLEDIQWRYWINLTNEVQDLYTENYNKELIIAKMILKQQHSWRTHIYQFQNCKGTVIKTVWKDGGVEGQ